MQLYYDEDMVIESREDDFIIYSPSTHEWMQGNKFVKEAVEIILEDEGQVDFNKLIDFFKKEYNKDLKEEEIGDLLKKLIQTKLFFASEEKFNQAQQKAVEDSKTPKDHPLKAVYVHPTFKCNFDCTYCYNQNFETDIDELSTEQWIEVINELIEEHPIERINFTGGEPLIRDDLGEILQATKTDDVSFALLTNGSLLKEKFSEVVPHLDKIIMSLDSFDLDINALNRSAEGFDDIIETIELFSEQAPDKLEVRAVITKNNCEDVDEFNEHLEQEYGIETRNVWFIPNNKEEIEKVPGLEHYFNIDDHRDYPIYAPAMKVNRCDACVTVIALDPKGDVYPCQTLLYDEFKMTNILKDNWHQELFTSDVREKFRNLVVDEIEECSDCSYRYICGGGCPAIAYDVYGSLDSYIEYFCSYMKKGARNILKVADIDFEES